MPPGRLLPRPFNTGVIHGYGEENDSERLGSGFTFQCHHDTSLKNSKSADFHKFV